MHPKQTIAQDDGSAQFLIGAALKSIHENAKAPWTVESLAFSAGMSQSAFATRFKELLGQTSLDYVTEWRMQKAIERLRQN